MLHYLLKRLLFFLLFQVFFMCLINKTDSYFMWYNRIEIFTFIPYNCSVLIVLSILLLIIYSVFYLKPISKRYKGILFDSNVPGTLLLFFLRLKKIESLVIYIFYITYYLQICSLISSVQEETGP